jgi:bifunctional DNase/RNase
MVVEAFMGEDVKMTVAGITLDTTNNMPIIILKSENEDVAIPIWIGLIEASAIATELEGIKLGRPMTHDLLKNILEGLGGRLKRIVVNDLKENTFYASLFVELSGSEVEIDSRPSDAIALALRCGAEIFVSRKVIDTSQHIDMSTLQATLDADKDGEGGKNKDKWTELLENLKPEDFGKYKM